MPARRVSADPGVVRLIDANGSSARSWDAAVADAVRSVADETGDPLGVEITRQWADLTKGRIARYRVSVRVAYRQPLPPAKKVAART